MRTLTSSLISDSVAGEEIKLPWYRLNSKLSFHTKELVMVAAAPGAGKSVFAINLVLGLEEPVLYLAMDSAPSVLARMVALEMGVPIHEAFDILRYDPDRAIERLEGRHPLLAIEAGGVSLERVGQLVDAAEEWLGRTPGVVILDNLISLIVPGQHPQDVGFYAVALPHLQRLALERNVCIIALHHITRRGNDNGRQVQGLGTRKLTMTDLLYSGEREAEHVLGIYHDREKTRLNIQVLKQRDGDADPEGNLEVSLRWHPEQGRLAAWS